MAESMVCFWTCEIEADFIEEARKNELSWDIKNPLYSKKSFKQKRYEEISIILQSRWPERSAWFLSGK